MRLFPALILLLLIFSGIAAVVPPSVRAQNSILILSDIALNPSAVPPGGASVANITVRNYGTSPVYGATITLTAVSPLLIQGTGSTFFLGDMSGNASVKISVSIGASPSAVSGNYPMPYTLNYANGTGGLRKEQLSSSGQLDVPVSGNPIRPVLTLTGVRFNPEIITPGTQFTMAVNITNTGNEEAFGSALNVRPGPDLSLVGTTGLLNLASLSPGQSEITSLEIAVDLAAPTETVPVNFVVSYIGKFGTPFSSDSNYTVVITATPDLRVGTFSLSSAPLRPGSSTGLTVSMLNVGGDRAYDVRLSASGSFFPSGPSVSYLGAIDSGGHGSAAFFLSVANNTAPGNYVLTLSFDYTDLRGATYSTTKNYTVPVEPYTSPIVTVTSSVIDPPVLSVGTQGTITVFLRNTGVTEARGVTITVQGGQGIVTSTLVGVGNLMPGESATQIIGLNIISSMHPGSYSLRFVVGYSDPAGNTYSTSVPLQTNIYGGAEIFTAFNVGVVAAIILLGVVAFIVLRRYKAI